MPRKQYDISLVLIWIVIFVLMLIMSISLALYCYYFQGGISTDHIQWAEFGDYIAGIAGVLNVIAFVGLTCVIHKTEKEQADRSMRFRAVEFIINKIQSQQKEINALYVQFQKKHSKETANETFELLQPLMTYFYYLKHINFLTDSTKYMIDEVHKYFFTASDILYTYALDIYDDKDKQIVNVLKVYREISQRLGELEVTMLTDIADVADYGVVITNFKDKQE